MLQRFKNLFNWFLRTGMKWGHTSQEMIWFVLDSFSGMEEVVQVSYVHALHVPLQMFLYEAAGYVIVSCGLSPEVCLQSYMQ